VRDDATMALFFEGRSAEDPKHVEEFLAEVPGGPAIEHPIHPRRQRR
jgi:truncated hemoglobin YjbI